MDINNNPIHQILGDGESRRYEYNNLSLPSVHAVMSILDPNPFFDYGALEEGRATHSDVEAYYKETKWPIDLAAEKIVNWLNGNNFYPICVEQPLYSPQYGYARYCGFYRER